MFFFSCVESVLFFVVFGSFFVLLLVFVGVLFSLLVVIVFWISLFRFSVIDAIESSSVEVVFIS